MFDSVRHKILNYAYLICRTAQRPPAKGWNDLISIEVINKRYSCLKLSYSKIPCLDIGAKSVAHGLQKRGGICFLFELF